MNIFKSMILILTIVAFNAHSYTVFSGFGSCKTWNMYGEKDKENTIVSGTWTSILVAWLAGFSTGINIGTGEENFPDIDLETMKEYTINYCKKNPTGDAYDAVLEIRKKIIK